MTKLILTGAGGFAGHHFLEHVLATTDWDIICTDSFRHRGKTDRINEVLAGHDGWRRRTGVITHDLSAPFSQQAFIRMAGEEPVDYVIAYASESHVERSITDPVPFVMNNVSVALNTLEMCRALKPEAVVLVSTDEVYGPQLDGQPPHPEWSPVLPSNPYAASKAAQEAIATAYWRTYGVPVIIIQCMNMFGERQDPEKFIPMVIGTVQEGRTVSVHGAPADVGTRHYLHARNLADGIMFLLRDETGPAVFPAHQDKLSPKRTGNRPDRYNIASADRIDNLAMAQAIAGYAGGELRYQFTDFHATRPGHDPHYGLDPAKMTALGWKPPVPFAESLERTVKWTLAHPAWMVP